tara:strand:+ start:232 stop:459 length:228 start_codon:yes stop_codon:yes gene_type:complete
MEDCPISCVNVGCTPPDFLEKHESFVLTVIAFISTGFGMLLNYFLRSRCTFIKFGCVSCKRTPVEITNDNIQIEP